LILSLVQPLDDSIDVVHEQLPRLQLDVVPAQREHRKPSKWVRMTIAHLRAALSRPRQSDDLTGGALWVVGVPLVGIRCGGTASNARSLNDWTWFWM
jgi:hypothetical protein